MNEPQLRMGPREWALMGALSVLWGGSFFFFKILVAQIPPFTVVLGRVALAALILNVVLVLRGQRLSRDPQLWGSFAVMGLLNNVLPFTLIAFGETRIAGGLASILNATTPIFGIIAAHFLTSNERMTPGKLIGVACGFCGVAAMIGPGVFTDIGSVDILGEVSCLLAAAIYALAGVYGRQFRGVPPLEIATAQLTASTAIVLPWSLLIDHPWALPMPTQAAWLAWIGLAVFSTALAYILFFRILAAAGASNSLLVTFLVPVSALFLGVAFQGEMITTQALIGMAAIGCGLAAIDGRPWQALVALRQRLSA